MWETWVPSLGWEDTLEKGKATHSSILTWRIPWTVQSMGLQRVECDFHFFSYHEQVAELGFEPSKIELDWYFPFFLWPHCVASGIAP